MRDQSRWVARAVVGFTLLAVAAAIALAACGDGEEPGIAVPARAVTVEVSGDGVREELFVELALTAEERARGLMKRQELPENAGMFFAFDGMVHTAFWMKDTYVPLDIAFLAEDGRVQEIKGGEPLNEELLQPALPYRYVLEVNQGWFERHGLGPGAVVSIPAQAQEATP